MVEQVGKIGDALGVVWAFFQDESGQLTLLASVLLATLALATAYRCFAAMRPALGAGKEEKLSNVVAVGSAMTAIFAAVGLFFLVQVASRVMG